MSGLIFKVSEKEHYEIIKAKKAGKTLWTFSDGNGFNLNRIDFYLDEEKFKAFEKQELKAKGKYRCKYGKVHWLTDPCNCFGFPGEMSEDEIKERKKKLQKQNNLIELGTDDKKLLEHRN